MLVLHVYIMGKRGNIERSYDFLQNNHTEELEGVDVVIPYEEEIDYPLSEHDAIAVMDNKRIRGDH